MTRPNRKPENKPSKPAMPTDWSDVAEWYDQLVGEEGSEYQRHVVFPGVLRLLKIQPGETALDVACGQGVFSRILHERGAKVTGVDAALELIKIARQRNEGLKAEKAPLPEYLVGDAKKLNFLPTERFNAATCLLAIQNIETLPPVFEGIAKAMTPQGRLVLVMMHPCFRGPKYTSWGWDEAERVQYRRVDRYLMPRKEPIFTHPGKKTGQYTWTFHRPIEMYIRAMRNAGLLVDAIEEWASHKSSTSGPRAGAENMARKEIPMFLAIRALKMLPAVSEKKEAVEERG